LLQKDLQQILALFAAFWCIPLVCELSFSKLLQTFSLLQIHEIWYGAQGNTNKATCKVSAHSIYNFLFYNNLQQILVLFTAFFSIPLFFFIGTIKKVPKMQNIKFQPNILPNLQIAGNTHSFS